jgi:isoquinoline 1-oxidoreductase subunit alpha
LCTKNKRYFRTNSLIFRNLALFLQTIFDEFTSKKLSLMETYSLTINGKSIAVTASADTPMLWVLREHLQLVGTKYGCGIGQCGACTIHLDGTAVRSCQLPVAAVDKQAITTIEGLSADASHPVQKAWLEHDVAQCGYCQAGQIMNACAFLNETKVPSDADIDAAMNGNICRCGTYNRIKAAIKTASKTMLNP